MRKTLAGGAAAILLAALPGCFGPKDKPEFTFMPDMAYSPAYKAQEEGSMRLPVKGTVPRHMIPYAYAGDPEGAGRELRNPLKMTRANLHRGQELFGIYCKTCHGPQGQGDGSIVPKFPRPPSLTSNKVHEFPDGRIYHIVTEGQNLMPGYTTQIDRQDRWAIVHYVRVLYRAMHASAEDVIKAGKM